ncbi:MAG: hypothetical protein NTY01_22855 [Verrucomicrobia bacterium]|nr:hypothetical protein [Verrucomicrobiota bacterium]
MNRNDDTKPVPVAATPPQAGETRDRDPRWWVECSVWTGRMLTRLASGGTANRQGFAHCERLSLAAAHEWTRTIVATRTH